MNNKFFTACGIVLIEKKVLLVRHTYGTAKNRILLPGGYVKENEMPEAACEREVFEETGVTAKAKALAAMQFKPQQWCAYFLMDYVAGVPMSDGHENSEALLLLPEEAVLRADITNMSRAVLKKFLSADKRAPAKHDFCPSNCIADEYSLY